MGPFRQVFVGTRFTLLGSTLVTAATPDRVTLQLKWTHQFQFAGYYAAIAQGHYREAGLEVVLKGEAEVGVGTSDRRLLRNRGEPVVVLAAIFQHSPLVLLVRTASRVTDLQGLHDRELMMLPSESADAAKGRYLGMLSHEIRTPLNGILGMINLLRAETFSVEGREHRELLDHSGRTLLKLINDLLNFARFDSGRVELEQLPVEPAVFVRELCTLFRPAAEAKGVRLRADVRPEVPPGGVDRSSAAAAGAFKSAGERDQVHGGRSGRNHGRARAVCRGHSGMVSDPFSRERHGNRHRARAGGLFVRALCADGGIRGARVRWHGPRTFDFETTRPAPGRQHPGAAHARNRFGVHVGNRSRPHAAGEENRGRLRRAGGGAASVLPRRHRLPGDSLARLCPKTSSVS